MQHMFAIAIILCLVGSVFSQSIVVGVAQGNLRGIRRLARNNDQFYSFRSIPYAAPPVGNLRFRDPQAPINWQGERDASQDMPFCVQASLTSVIGQEDCLYLNVHTREFPALTNTTIQKPVMVWIHGGFFASGSGREDYHNPEYLMTQNIVLVTINYRLNMFGFFSLDDATLGVPGNAGLKDQVMALRWIRENIRNFGGNSSEVTIFGQGSGGVSVHYHLLSPLSRGLFHRGIMQSGTALSPWTPGLRNNGLRMAQELNINTTSRSLMMETLRWLLPQQIIEGYQRLSRSTALNWGSVINPIIETQTDGTAFLRENPLTLIIRGEYNDVPLMIGYTDSEGIGVDQLMRYLHNTDESMVMHDFTTMIPPDLNIRSQTEAERNISESIRNFYFPTQQTQPNRTGLITMFTDIWFGFPALRTATLHIRTTNATIHFYKFSADTTLNVFKRRDTISALIPGASHEDDIAYLFKTILTPDIPPASIEDFAINRMVTLWTSFAFGGNVDDPSLRFTWTPISPPTPQINYVVHFAHIDTHVTTMRVNPHEVSMSFWSDIYRRDFGSNASITTGFMFLVTVLTYLNLLA